MLTATVLKTCMQNVSGYYSRLTYKCCVRCITMKWGRRRTENTDISSINIFKDLKFIFTPNHDQLSKNRVKSEQRKYHQSTQ